MDGWMDGNIMIDSHEASSFIFRRPGTGESIPLCSKDTMEAIGAKCVRSCCSCFCPLASLPNWCSGEWSCATATCHNHGCHLYFCEYIYMYMHVYIYDVSIASSGFKNLSGIDVIF